MSQAQRIAEDDEDPEIARLRAAVEEARSADSVPHERVRDWLLELAQGKKAPPPLP